MTKTRRSPRGSRVANARVQKPAPSTRITNGPQKPTTAPSKTSKKKRTPRTTNQYPAKLPRVEQGTVSSAIQDLVEGTEKVARVYNELWESTPDSLAFIDHGLLDTGADTETIALNLIDHIIKEENWNPALSMNKLSAACFLFASRVTGKKNAAEEIALSFEPDAERYALALLAMVHQSRVASDPTVLRRTAEALKMSAGDVEYGYRILWEQRSDLRELVGPYASYLEWLPMPAGVSMGQDFSQAAIEEDPQQAVPARDEAEEAKAEERMRVAEAPLISPAFSELDDFETCVAENE